jgi:O-antigen/teichoic acid export membrane protein
LLAISPLTGRSEEPSTVWSVVIRNAASGYLKVFVMMAAAFVVTPVLIRELGTADYGLWLLLSAITGHYLLFDLGFRRTLIHDISIRREHQSQEEMREVVSSFLILVLAIGALIILVTVLLALALPSLFDIPPERVDDARIVLVLLGLAWAVQLPSNIAGGVLRAYERYDVVNGLDSLTRIVTSIAIIAIVATGYGIATLAAGVALIQVLGAVVMVATGSRLAPAFGLTVRGANLSYLRAAFNRSTSYFAISINSLVNTRFDELIIGVVLPLSAVGIYGVSLRLIHMARNVSLQLNEVLIPRTSRLVSQPGDAPHLRSMIVSATRISTGLTAGIALMFIAFGRPFLDLWIGPEVEEAYWPLVILSVALVIGMAQDMPSKAVYASARHRMGAAVTIGGLLANMALSILLVHRLEITGVALATLLAWSCAGTVMIVVGCRMAGLAVTSFVREGLLPVTLPTIPAGLIALGLQQLLPASSWPLLVVESVVVWSFFVATCLLVLFSPRELMRFAVRAGRAVRRRRDRLSVAGLAAGRQGKEADIEAVR